MGGFSFFILKVGGQWVKVKKTINLSVFHKKCFNSDAIKQSFDRTSVPSLFLLCWIFSKIFSSNTLEKLFIIAYSIILFYLKLKSKKEENENNISSMWKKKI